MPVINISVKDKIASVPVLSFAVGDNSDYTVHFSLDAEWDAFPVRTARFIYRGLYQDIPFEGNDVVMPVINGADRVEIGLFAGDLHTTTPAVLYLNRSILDGDPSHVDPPEDVYDQLIQLISERAIQGPPGDDGFSPVVEITEIEGGHRISITTATGTEDIDVLDGEQGPQGIQGERGLQGTQGAQGDRGPQGEQGPRGYSGADGTDGFSPVVEITEIEGGHRISITTATGTEDIDVMDGEGAVSSVNGKTGAVVLDAEDVGAYELPAGGIPESDLSAAVAAKLNAEEVYWCTYGTTTFAQIDAALDAGKLPVCIYSDRYYIYAGLSNAYHCFASLTATTYYRLYLKGSWGSGSISLSNLYSKPSGGIPASDLAAGVIPDELADLAGDSTHRTVTDAEKAAWDAKQGALTAGAGISISDGIISCTFADGNGVSY